MAACLRPDLCSVTSQLVCMSPTGMLAALGEETLLWKSGAYFTRILLGARTTFVAIATARSLLDTQTDNSSTLAPRPWTTNLQTHNNNNFQTNPTVTSNGRAHRTQYKIVRWCRQKSHSGRPTCITQTSIPLAHASRHLQAAK